MKVSAFWRSIESSRWNGLPVMHLVLLVIMTTAAFALRMYHLDFQSLWYDELHSIIPTAPDQALSSIVEYCKTDQPPFFFIFIHYIFKVFGYNEVIGRLAVAIVGVIGVPVMFLLGKEIRGNRVGLYAALLTSLNYMHIYYSQELRFYSMVFLLTALSYLFLVRAFRRDRLIDYFLYVASTIALLYTHYYGLVVYGSQAVVFLVLTGLTPRKEFAWKGILSGILVAVAFLPWVPVIISDLGIESFWIQMPKPTFIADYFYYYFGKDALATVFLLFFLYLFVKQYLSMKPGERFLDYIIICWLILSYLIPYIKSLIGTPMLYVRYTIIALPAWILVLAVGWDQIKSARWIRGTVVVVSLSMLINLVFVRKHYSRISKQQFREAHALVHQLNSNGFPVYSNVAWHFNYYFRNDSIKVVDPRERDLSTVGKFWLLNVEFFSASEKDQLTDAFAGEFEVEERHSLFKTEVLLMRRK